MLTAADKDARHAEWLLERQFPDEFGRPEPRTIIIQQNPVARMPPPVVTTAHQWHTKDVPPELVRYLDLLRRADSIAKRKTALANSNGKGAPE